MFGKTFYPTPDALIEKMLRKIKSIDTRSAKVLEPSAGKGDIIEKLCDKYNYGSEYYKNNMSAIEIDEDLQATLRGKSITVIDADFLTFAGPDKFDLIISNPPFDAGDLHLLKAIESTGIRKKRI